MYGLYKGEADRSLSLQIIVMVTRIENDSALTNLLWVSVLFERIGNCKYNHRK